MNNNNYNGSADKLSDAMGMIDNNIITEAQKSRKTGKKRKRIWVSFVAVAVCVCIVAVGVLSKLNPMTASALSIAEATYPVMAQYPADGYNSSESDYNAWMDSKQAQLEQSKGYREGLEDFYAAIIKQLLSGDNKENRVCSPLNVYMALAMLAEITDGNSRQQILDLLGSDSVDELRKKASGLWNASYCKDGATTSVLANSMWLNENVNYNKSAMDTLAKDYYASSYRGQMGSDELNKALQGWLNEQTGGLLKEQAAGVETDPRTIIALASAIYFQAKWHDEFQKSDTSEGVFNTASGEAVNCDFMHQSGSRAYFWGESFTAIPQYLDGGGCMWLLLPDEGVTAEQLLSDSEAMRLCLANEEWKNQKHVRVNLSIPKFDVASDIDLTDGLKALGITDVFDDTVSDFSALTSDADELFISKADHAARVCVDEEGCTAAAYTVMMADGTGGEPDEEVDFVLDRPFVFVITSAGSPLFAGIVNHM